MEKIKVPLTFKKAVKNSIVYENKEVGIAFYLPYRLVARKYENIVLHIELPEAP